jgi:hypothetical protein
MKSSVFQKEVSRMLKQADMSILDVLEGNGGLVLAVPHGTEDALYVANMNSTLDEINIHHPMLVKPEYPPRWKLDANARITASPGNAAVGWLMQTACCRCTNENRERTLTVWKQFESTPSGGGWMVDAVCLIPPVGKTLTDLTPRLVAILAMDLLYDPNAGRSGDFVGITAAL